MMKVETIKKYLRRIKDVKNFSPDEKERERAYGMEQALSWILNPKEVANPIEFFKGEK